MCNIKPCPKFKILGIKSVIPENEILNTVVDAIAQNGYCQHLDLLVESLSHFDFDISSSAAIALSQIRCDDHTSATSALEKGISQLVNKLEDPDSYTRHEAARYLGKISSEKALSELSKKLKNQDFIVANQGENFTQTIEAFEGVQQGLKYYNPKMNPNPAAQRENPQGSSHKTILVLAPSPTNAARLRQGKEVQEINEGLLLSPHRDQFRLKQRWAVRPRDLRRALLHLKPQIVHFSGHGAGDQGLILENETGEAQFVSTNALSDLFRLFADQGVECVVLNACYSQVQADAISQHINFVVGMSNKISDDAAIEFAIGFYDALAAGRSYEDAYHFGRNAIAMYDIPEEHIPILKKKTN